MDRSVEAQLVKLNLDCSLTRYWIPLWVCGFVLCTVGELKPANLLLKVESQAADSGADKSGAASVVTGEKVENCGLPSPCDTDSVAVHLFSGKENTAGPRMCIGGA